MIDPGKAAVVLGSVVTIGYSLLVGGVGAFIVWVGLTFATSSLAVLFGGVMIFAALGILWLGFRKRPPSP